MGLEVPALSGMRKFAILLFLGKLQAANEESHKIFVGEVFGRPQFGPQLWNDSYLEM